MLTAWMCSGAAKLGVGTTFVGEIDWTIGMISVDMLFTTWGGILVVITPL